MEAKYYIPSIEEFCVGFEFEIYTISSRTSNKDSEWINFKIKDFEDLMECHNQMTFEGNIDAKYCRVKHLDQEDIESLEWKFYSQGNVNFFTFRTHKDGHIQMHASFGAPTLISFSTYDGLETMRFKIKNKSDLKKLMIQIDLLKQ